MFSQFNTVASGPWAKAFPAEFVTAAACLASTGHVRTAIVFLDGCAAIWAQLGVLCHPLQRVFWHAALLSGVRQVAAPQAVHQATHARHGAVTHRVLFHNAHDAAYTKETCSNVGVQQQRFRGFLLPLLQLGQVGGRQVQHQYGGVPCWHATVAASRARNRRQRLIFMCNCDIPLKNVSKF